MATYRGVVGNRDYIKYRGERLPFWYFLDRQPAGWLCSLAYKRHDLPAGQNIGDCGAWSYRGEDVPRLGKDTVTAAWAIEQYQALLKPGDYAIAPDHMLIPGLGDLDARRRFNCAAAREFLELCPFHLTPVATVHGTTLDERLNYGVWLVHLGYSALALGGLAGQASKKAMVLEVVELMRREFPGVWIHVLGLSSPFYAREWQRLGVDSFDGASHFKQAFTAGRFFVERNGEMVGYQAARPGQPVTAPACDCRACAMLREDGIDTRSYGSNECNMGRAAHNLNTLMRVIG